MRRMLSAIRIPNFVFFGAFAIFAWDGMTPGVSAQTRTLRIVAYNIQDDVNGITTPTAGLINPFTGTGGNFTTNSSGSVTNGGALEGIGEEAIGGDAAQPIDILALEETTSNTSTVQPIVDGLNAFYTFNNIPAGYAMSSYQATESGNSPTTGNGPNALVYNTNTVQLLASVPVDPSGGTSQLGSASGEYREVMRYEFAPAGVPPTTNNVFYIYVSHYKADPGSVYDTDRLGEATIIRNDESTNLPSNARVLYVGDYNVDDNSAEPGYQTILSNAAPDGVQQGGGVDPLNTSASTTIDWSDYTTNPTILAMLTEENYDLRYRDDLQVMTSNVYYDVAGGLQYVPGTYHAFGNNGSLPYGDTVVDTANTALSGISPGALISPAQTSTNLTGASDHLPIVADYILPLDAAPPLASFTANPTSGPAPLTVTFTDTSTGVITNRFWNFGDGTTTNITGTTITHVYAVGTDTVTLIDTGYSGVSTNTQVNLITAVVPTVYTITTSASPSPDGTTGGGGPHTNGTPATVTATANSCYLFVNWTVGATVVSTAPHYTFIVSSNLTLVANFVPTTTYTITTVSSPAAGGSISGGGTVACISNTTVCATANSCYAFVNWTDQYSNVVSTSACYNFAPNASATLTANFVSLTDTITAGVNPPGSGSTTGGGAVPCGTGVTVCANPTPCFAFVNWTLNSSAVSTSPCYSFTAASNETLVANFATISYGGPNGANLTTLHSFNSTDGQYPIAGVILGSDGNFYGTTEEGGTSNNGTVFRMTPTGSLTTLHSFTGPDGVVPYVGLVQANDGNFYGTTYQGGTNDYGTIFRITSSGTLTTLHLFVNRDGAYPLGSLAAGNDGNLYGTTEQGGTSVYGTLFRITPSGTLTTLHSFNYTSDGAFPFAGLVMGSDSNFYGTTYYGPGGTFGSVFRITPSGTLTTLHAFTGNGADGSYPSGNLVQGSDGNFYGTTTAGGIFSNGVLFQITPGGTYSNLWSFSGCSDGEDPYGALLQGNDGNFYGTTSGGGSGSYGTVFRFGPGGSFTNLWSFTDGTDGAISYATLVQGNDGDLYGTAITGGANSDGTVFKINADLCGYVLNPSTADFNPSGGSGTLNVTATSRNCVWTNASNSSFITITSGSSGTGSEQVSYTVAPDTNTNSFGRTGTMTIAGRTFTVTQASLGCSFTLSATNTSFNASSGSGSVTVNVNGLDCAWTAASNNGFITITSGGSSNGNGMVTYAVTANTNSSPLTGTMTIAGQTFTVTQGGFGCSAVLTLSSSPAVGGTTSGGSTVACGSNITACATANPCFSFVNWTINGNVVSGLACDSFAVLSNETLVANFAPISYVVGTSSSPSGGGTTSGGGTVACGSNTTVCATPNSCYAFVNWTDQNNNVVSTSACYTFTPDANTSLTAHFTAISSYTIGAAASPVVDGFTTTGGAAACGSNVTLCATANSCYSFVNWTDQNSNVVSTSACYSFVVTGNENLVAHFVITDGATGAGLTNLWSFTGGSDGANPESALVQGQDGNFYGTTYGAGSGPSGYGTVFRISINGTLTNLWSFTNGVDGANPGGGLVQAKDGNFYGTTYGAGSGPSGYGTVFRISTNGTLTNLWSFTNGVDGANPYAALVQGSDGNFYGATAGSGSGPSGYGTVFRITATGSLSNLHSFVGSDGANPSAALIQGRDGNFYSTAYAGGNGYGTVFRISPSGSLTTLWSFTNGVDGGNPYAALIQGSDGNFYGTTSGSGSGPGGYGTVFRISPNGNLSNLWDFADCADGAVTFAGLAQGSDGNFYGTTSGLGSGPSLYGTVFQISSSGTLKNLWAFTNGVDGANPFATLAQGSDGNFYGTTDAGGANGRGALFRLSVPLDPPANQISALQMTGSNMIVNIPSVAGETYQLQYSDSLTLGNWSNIGGASMTNSAGGMLSLTNFGGIAGSQRFYRFDITP